MKKLILGLAALGTALVMIPLFAAFEAHVINVTATIENALSVATRAINFGTVFPEEKLNQPLGVALSSSFLQEGRVDDVQYVIREKPKCTNEQQIIENPDGTFSCPQGSTIMPLLCPFLSKHPDGLPEPSNDGSIDAFHGPLLTWTLQDSIANQVTGVLSKLAGDTDDTWNVDLVVPCFAGSCSQDNLVPPQYQLPSTLESVLFGCDLWVEVTGISTEVTLMNSTDIAIEGLDLTGMVTLGNLVNASTTYYYSVRTISSLSSTIPTVQWKVTIDGPSDLIVGMVEVDELGWKDVGPNPDSATVFHYPMSVVGGNLVAKGSCATAASHDDSCTVDDFDVDPLDDFTNVDSIHFATSAPSGTYLIKRQLVDTGTGAPISNELIVRTVTK